MQDRRLDASLACRVTIASKDDGCGLDLVRPRHTWYSRIRQMLPSSLPTGHTHISVVRNKQGTAHCSPRGSAIRSANKDKTDRRGHSRLTQPTAARLTLPGLCTATNGYVTRGSLIRALISIPSHPPTSSSRCLFPHPVCCIPETPPRPASVHSYRRII